MNCRRSRLQGGFALLAVLVLLAILSIIASSVVLLTERSVEDMQVRIDEVHDSVDALSTRETVMFLLATQRMTVGGLTVDERIRLPDGSVRFLTPTDEIEGYSYLPLGNEIRLDGTIYSGLGRTHFMIQDGRGLVNPNWSPRVTLRGWLSSLGVPPGNLETLEDSLADAQDSDDLRRLNGAESREYRAADRPAPINRPFTTPLELRRVRGWDRALASIDEASLVRSVQLATDPFINLNTAPASTLEAIPGVGTREAARTIDLRQGAPWSTTWAWARDFGVGDEAVVEGLFVTPSKNGTLSICQGESRPCELLHWTLTGNDEGGYPWRFNYDYLLPYPAASGREVSEEAPTSLLTPSIPDGERVFGGSGR